MSDFSEDEEEAGPTLGVSGSETQHRLYTPLSVSSFAIFVMMKALPV